MKTVTKLTIVFTKIIEVFHWVGAGLLAAAAICSVAAPRWLGHFMDVETLEQEAEFTVYGLRVAVTSGGDLDRTAFFIAALCVVVIFVLVALVFRNLHQIVKASEGSTPFQPANVKRLKRIGILFMAVPVMNILTTVLLRLFVGPDRVEGAVDFGGVTTALLVLCLTQFFARGVALERDVDGLL